MVALHLLHRSSHPSYLKHPKTKYIQIYCNELAQSPPCSLDPRNIIPPFLSTGTMTNPSRPTRVDRRCRNLSCEIRSAASPKFLQHGEHENRPRGQLSRTEPCGVKSNRWRTWPYDPEVKGWVGARGSNHLLRIWLEHY